MKENFSLLAALKRREKVDLNTLQEVYKEKQAKISRKAFKQIEKRLLYINKTELMESKDEVLAEKIRQFRFIGWLNFSGLLLLWFVILIWL